MDKYSSNNQTNIHKRLTKRFFIAKQSDPYTESKRMPTAQLLDCCDLLDTYDVYPFFLYYNHL